MGGAGVGAHVEGGRSWDVLQEVKGCIQDEGCVPPGEHGEKQAMMLCPLSLWRIPPWFLPPTMDPQPCELIAFLIFFFPRK